MNPFESGARKVIPSVLVYGRFEDQVLMLHRNGRLKTGVSQTAQASPSEQVDFHEGKWNGLGGKCELDESPLDAVCREFREESGLDIPLERFKSLGVLQFPNFKPHKQEDWIVFVFTVKLFATDLGPLKTSPSAEGTLHWVLSEDLLSLNLWPGDRYFIPYILKEESFVGTVWYDHLKVSKWWIQSLGLTKK